MPLARSAKTKAQAGAPTPEEMLAARLSNTGVVGDSASPQALARLNAALADMKAAAVRPILEKAVEALQAREPVKGGELALQALTLDETNGYAWYLLAIAREGLNDFRSSLECYEAALQLMPNQSDVANDLGRLAARMGMDALAEKLFRAFIQARPDNMDAYNNLACALRNQDRTDEAIEILSSAIMTSPGTSHLWSTLGTVLSERGDVAESLPFFDEALRLAPEAYKCRYNRSTAYLALGDAKAALADCKRALKSRMLEYERTMMTMAKGTMLITLGDLERGWEAYEARLSPYHLDVTHFLIERPRWQMGDDLAGKSFLLVGEQGLGDEILFANMVPDLLEALGPEGKLSIAVQERLIPLFEQAFPTAIIGRHNTLTVDGHTVRGIPFIKDWDSIDLWAPMASLLRRFRNRVEAFPDRERFMTADPARVDYWRGVLAEAGPGPKVGLLWKSLKLQGARARHFSPFHQWKPILETPGVIFVNMQYGECAEEIAAAQETLGVEIWQPPGIDLKNDLADVGALACALDLTIGPANATTNIAAACGAPVWLVSTPGSWPRLGTERYPWYPQVKVFVAPAFNDWAPVMAEVADALSETFPALGRAGTEARPSG